MGTTFTFVLDYTYLSSSSKLKYIGKLFLTVNNGLEKLKAEALISSVPRFFTFAELDTVAFVSVNTFSTPFELFGFFGLWL